jgi:RNA ligase (TIGR02306 family)
MYKNNERMLAWITKIDKIEKHPNADSLDICTIGGWKCITKLGEFNLGEMVVYISIDSFIPNTVAPFLSKDKEPKEYNGIKGERLRTIKLRGTISQGLLLPIDILNGHMDYEDYIHLNVGDDVTENLGIQKYEPPIPACLSGVAKGVFPSFIPKTDAERIQNIDLNEYVNHHYEVSEKIDGSSGTFYVNDGEFNVCSRNLNLAYSKSNTFWKVAIKNNLEEKLKKLGLNIAIQGEVVGPGIQKNKYNLKDHELYVFNIYDINKGEYFSVEERQTFCEELGLNHVPVIDEVYLVDVSIDNWLKFAEGKSALNNQTEREGLVFKRVDDCYVNFKCISNKFLLKSE